MRVIACHHVFFCLLIALTASIRADDDKTRNDNHQDRTSQRRGPGGQHADHSRGRGPMDGRSFGGPGGGPPWMRQHGRSKPPWNAQPTRQGPTRPPFMRKSLPSSRDSWSDRARAMRAHIENSKERSRQHQHHSPSWHNHDKHSKAKPSHHQPQRKPHGHHHKGAKSKRDQSKHSERTEHKPRDKKSDRKKKSKQNDRSAKRR